ncbi:MAG TPA: rhodanese-like domain-containing protein [Candidatus Angelobacter sp.]|nr:rhodanese-like domain-containing protein [Candidatus Angelobacter sp.]
MRALFSKTILLLAPLLGVIAPLGAQAPGSDQPKLRKEMLVTTEWLAAHLHDPDLVVLSVGATPEFYSKSHIPGARQILLSEIAVTRDDIPNELPPVEKLQAVFAAAGVRNNSRSSCMANATTCWRREHTLRLIIWEWQNMHRCWMAG